MKTTLEIDAIFRRARSVAAERGIPLPEYSERIDPEMWSDSRH